MNKKIKYEIVVRCDGREIAYISSHGYDRALKAVMKYAVQAKGDRNNTTKIIVEL